MFEKHSKIIDFVSKFVVSIRLIRHTIRSFSKFFRKKVNFDQEDEDQKFETREREKMEKHLLSGIKLFFNSQSVEFRFSGFNSFGE